MKKIKYGLLAACCMACFFTAAAQDSITQSRYNKIPPMANPKQLNKTTAVSKDLNSQVQQKATNQYGPPPGPRNAPPSNPYATIPKKPANAPDNQIADPQNGYDDVPPPPAGSVPPSNNYGKAPPMANPKQLNRSTAVQKDLNSQVQQKATNQYGPPPGSRNAPPSNPYATIPKKPANAPDNQIADPQNGYDDVPPPPAGSVPSSNNYGKAPPMANPKQLNRSTAVQKDLNSQVQQKATNQYGPPPGSRNAPPSNPYATIPKKPANAPDNQIADPQNGYDDVPPPPAGSAPPSNNYGKAPPMANPKQLNRSTAVQKDLNSQVQQKATNQYGPPPVSGNAASNPKSQYGPLPAPGRTQQYGPAPALPKSTAPASAVNSNTKPGMAPAQPAASGRTQQYGTVPPLPKAVTPVKKG